MSEALAIEVYRLCNIATQLSIAMLPQRGAVIRIIKRPLVLNRTKLINFQVELLFIGKRDGCLADSVAIWLCSALLCSAMGIQHICISVARYDI